MNQGPIWGRFMKKIRGQKSRATVPLTYIHCFCDWGRRIYVADTTTGDTIPSYSAAEDEPPLLYCFVLVNLLSPALLNRMSAATWKARYCSRIR
jgi:hypothetical protein